MSRKFLTPPQPSPLVREGSKKFTIVEGGQLDTINVEKSSFCRLNSDCCDVKLEFKDLESV
ncbi:cyanobactin maturation protease PatG family protein [Microcoleus sp. herbarium2]|uniref:cyanobactin maturation protease PatG family protein n=1 Tax=Microcoleus sp. herbarium2 TaxID=3055433 RepID=UPI0040406E84